VKKESIFLSEVKALLDDKEVTLGEIADKLHSKGLVFLSLISVLPFLQPIPLPGISSVLGFVIVLQGIGLIFFNKPLLTNKMRSMTLSPQLVERFIIVSQKIYPWLSWMVTGIGKELTHFRLVRIVSGITLVGLALFLSLPLPVIGSNFLPAIGIFCTTLGLLEEDFVLVVAGIFYALVFTWLTSLSIELLIEQMNHWTLF
jgi:hypothetical protein